MCVWVCLSVMIRHPFLLEAAAVNSARKELSKLGPGASDEDVDAVVAGLSDLTMMTATDEHEQTEANDDADAYGASSSSSSRGRREVLLQKKLSSDSTVFEVVGREPSLFELQKGSVRLRVLLRLCKRLVLASHRVLAFDATVRYLSYCCNLCNRIVRMIMIDLHCYDISDNCVVFQWN